MLNVIFSPPLVFILKLVFMALKTSEKFSLVGELPFPDVFTRRNVVLLVRELTYRAICLANLTAIKRKNSKRTKTPTVEIAYLHENFKQLTFEIVLNFHAVYKSQVLVLKLFAGTCLYQVTVVPC